MQQNAHIQIDQSFQASEIFCEGDWDGNILRGTMSNLPCHHDIVPTRFHFLHVRHSEDEGRIPSKEILETNFVTPTLAMALRLRLFANYLEKSV